MKPFVLASQSPRRKQLLGQLIGQETFECIPSCANEVWIDADVDTAVLHIAKTKAKEIADRHSKQWVLGADTIVVDQQRILGKPKSLEEARQTLHKLSDHWHEVKTAVVLIAPEGVQPQMQEAVVTTKVHFRNLSDDEIERYVASGSPLDKAGSYGIQEVDFVDQIEGSFTNVIGLPMGLVENWVNAYFPIVQRAKMIEKNQE